MKSKRTIRSILVVTFALLGGNAWAVPIGIIDSGTDLKHPNLANKAWTNPGNLSGDSFKDDTHGWNFAEDNNEIIDYSLLGTFSPDMTQFFQVQLKLLQGTATDEEKQWMKDKKGDDKFIEELQTFGNFVHGTHVAGISARSADQAQLMAAKIIPTKVTKPGSGLEVQSFFDHFRLWPKESDPLTDMALHFMLGVLASQHSKTLIPVSEYVNVTGMAVANCSFGTSVEQAKKIVTLIAKSVLKKELTEAEQEKYGAVFLNQVIKKGAAFASSAPKALFVIAAGNDGSDNDKVPTFPANLKADNTITVAATRGYEKLASFSNYGATLVEIAAPGVGIISDIPGGETMPLSGTSQAAPFITNLAGQILDTNSQLTLTQVKQIMMQTVDKKDFLVGKVVSEGIANPDRALRAATLSTQMELSAAIDQAKREVNAVKVRKSILSRSSYDGEPIPLPSTFRF